MLLMMNELSILVKMINHELALVGDEHKLMFIAAHPHMTAKRYLSS